MEFFQGFFAAQNIIRDGEGRTEIQGNIGKYYIVDLIRWNVYLIWYFLRSDINNDYRFLPKQENIAGSYNSSLFDVFVLAGSISGRNHLPVSYSLIYLLTKYPHDDLNLNYL